MTQVGIRQSPLVFVDIETTGGSYHNSRVLEVGVVRVENNHVVATYNQLIDPGGPVPSIITRLTGITSSDIIGAPSFDRIEPELTQILDQAVFIAHNVRFDYGFLRMEFERLGLSFQPRLLCTVRLSRKLFPGVRGHKLQDLIDRHGFEAVSRHRAYDDAHVLWQFYQLIMREFDLDTVDTALAAQLKAPGLPPGLV
jgi:DNA polymerase-3 subunit epsilon